jgi:UDP-N-acetylglucosamine transferase subunit ALG13
MIFVTVGTDLPFDRLVRVVDQWAGATGRTDVFAQIGEGGWQPRHIPFARFLQPPEFKERFQSARVIVSHAGMGTILTALHQGKPILVMPKRASLREHRNEHQLATARHMMEKAGVNVAFDETELRHKLDHLDSLSPGSMIGSQANDSLIRGLRDFLERDMRK